MRFSLFASIVFAIAVPFAALAGASAATSVLPAPAGSLPTQISPYSATTTRDFLTSCKADHSSCVAMIGEALMDRAQFYPTTHICLPDINYADGVEAWLRAHPETAKMPTEDGIYLALKTVYRCGAPNNY